jgi:hypothetical protein
MHRGDDFAADEAVLAGQLVDDLERVGDLLRRVDHDGDRRTSRRSWKSFSPCGGRSP